MVNLRDQAAIVGIGATEFSKNSGRSELQLAVEASAAALKDAGLSPSDVDGISTYTADNNGEMDVARNLGIPALRFFSRTHYGGGGACAPLLQAAMAVTTGVADVVVCYRAMNERSGFRFGSPMQFASPTTENVMFYYRSMHGLQTPAAFLALGMRRYMYETGTTTEAFGNVAVSARRHASTNPKAFFYKKPLALDEYMSARMIADPFRLFDCCQESDGSVAIVITSADRARSLRQKAILIRAAAQSAPAGTGIFMSYYRPDISPTDENRFLAEQLYRMARLTPKDVQAAIFYDHFGPTVLPALEGFGFCARGEAKDFVKDGNIEVGGTLPVNTNGGQVGEAYIHGMNGVAEAVRQLRGTAVNQVRGAENIVVTGGSGVPTSGVILGVV